jgi:hypothetical protein
MSDSKEITQTGSSNPSGVTTLTVRTRYGGLREAQKDSKGRFLSKPKPLIPTIEFVRERRKRLAKARKDGTGTTEDIAILNELINLVNMPLATDAKTGLPDAKMAMVKVKAAEVIWLFTGGKPATAEQDLDRLKTQDVKVIIVEAPQLMNPEIKTAEEPKIKTKPSFIDAEVIEQN